MNVGEHIFKNKSINSFTIVNKMSSSLPQQEKIFTADMSADIFQPHAQIDYSLEGWATANNGLVILKGYRILMCRDYQTLKHVRIMSGGWAGSEPLYTGFVGPGMLTAIVLGDKFCSPPYPSILAAIRELGVGNPYGILLIVPNHPFTKINFILAVECALREKLPVKIIFVADDSSGLVDNQHGRTGLCGVTMVWKVAGAMAERNCCLEEIYNFCFDISSTHLSTITCNIVKVKNEVLDKKFDDSCSSKLSAGHDLVSSDISHESSIRTIEIKGDVVDRKEKGGIHSFQSLEDLAATLIGYTINGTYSPHSVILGPDSNIALLLNNYGSMENSEIYALVSELRYKLKHQGIKICRIYIGTVSTGQILDGFSVTVMKVNEKIIQYLDYPTAVPAWPKIFHSDCNKPESLPIHVQGRFHYDKMEVKELGPILSKSDTEKIFKVMEYVSLALMSCEGQINRVGANFNMSRFGTHMKNAAENINRMLYENRLKIHCPYALLQQLSLISSLNIANICGTYYALFFDAASQTDVAEAAEFQNWEVTDTKFQQQNLLPDPGAHTVAIWVRAVVEALKTPYSQASIAGSSSFCSGIDDFMYYP
ncbi:brahma associated protein 55kD isoform X2 [Lycorma delicatula]|uniref:triokinase/FMN cyclase-like isoform X2 n=1 Tax=Lycorma delicatula TaxID=130591 RepID=UPI003F5127D3